MSDGERVQKFLARAGVASRRKSEELIAAGRVTVDGRVVKLGDSVGSGAEVRLDGRLVERAAGAVTLMLHKPRGYVTTVRDERGRPTVLDLVPPLDGLHPVGRLDLLSEGLLLLTTVGDLTMRLTHPRFEHEKEYRVDTRPRPVAPDAAARLERGVLLEDGPARAVSARPRSGGVTIVLTEGRKRQVRRMLAEVGYEVERLVRTRIGGLALGDLPPGAHRVLDASDLRRLERPPRLV